jgi:hypothetical protein
VNGTERALQQITWEPVSGVVETGDDGLPYVTHSGILRIGAFELQCFLLNTGERVIEQSALEAFLGGPL